MATVRRGARTARVLLVRGVVLALVAALAASIPVGTPATRVSAADGADITGMFIDGWYPTAYWPVRPVSISGPAGAVGLESDDANVDIHGTDTGSSGAGTWYVVVSSRSMGVPLALGRVDYAQISGPSSACGSRYDGWADVLELTRAPDGTITTFAASVWARCPATNPVPDYVHAEVRYHSTIDYRGVDISPVPAISWPVVTPTIDFGTVQVGSRSDTRHVTVTNTGTLPLAVDATSASPEFIVDSTACAGATLAPAASCVIDVAFAPADVGAASTTLTIDTPELGSIIRSMTIVGVGGDTATIDVTPVGPPPVDMGLDGAEWFAVEVQPHAAYGTFDLYATCEPSGNGIHAALNELIAQPMYYWMRLPPGPCQVSIHFAGSGGWSSSDAGPVDFVVPSFSVVYTDTTTADGTAYYGHSRAGVPVTLTAWVEATNGVAPTGGTLEIVDVATGEVMGSADLTPDSLSLSVQTPPLDAGRHDYRAVYSGDATILGYTRDFAQFVDGDAPDGTVTIDDGTATTASPDIDLALAATDLTTSVAQVRVSNSPATTGGVLQTGITSAVTAAMPWTLPGTDGAKHVYAQWRDAVGNWSVPTAASIVLDRVAPAVTGPTWRLARGVLASGAAPVTISWTGTDATSGIARFELRQSTDGGPYRSVSTQLTWSSLARALLPGHAYRFQVRAVDRAGNVGAWTSGPLLRLSAIQQASGAIRYAGRWASSSSTVWWGGSARSSATAGSTATVVFTGRGFAWVSARASLRGIATIWVDGVRVATIDLRAASPRYRDVVWVRTWSTSATHTVTIRVSGTTGRPRVDLDGFLLLR